MRKRIADLGTDGVVLIRRDRNGGHDSDERNPANPNYHRDDEAKAGGRRGSGGDVQALPALRGGARLSGLRALINVATINPMRITFDRAKR
jgi:hypothetical protein